MRAAVVDGTVDELVTALARRADLTADHVAHAFACDPERVRQVLGADRVDAGELRDACIALSAADELRSTIVESACRPPVACDPIPARTAPLDDDAPIVLADVGMGRDDPGGAHSNSAERTESITRSSGCTSRSRRRAKSGSARGARMWSYLPNESDDPQGARHSRAIAHHADTIERIMTPEIGTLIDIADGRHARCAGTPRRIPFRRHSSRHSAASERWQRASPDRSMGLSDFADARWSSGGLRAAFAEVIADAVTAPSAPLAEALGAWPHDDVAGTAHRSIAGALPRHRRAITRTSATSAAARSFRPKLARRSGRRGQPGAFRPPRSRATGRHRCRSSCTREREWNGAPRCIRDRLGPRGRAGRRRGRRRSGGLVGPPTRRTGRVVAQHSLRCRRTRCARRRRLLRHHGCRRSPTDGRSGRERELDLRDERHHVGRRPPARRAAFRTASRAATC